MNLIDLKEAYKEYLNNTIDIKRGRLRVKEDVEGEITSYSLIDYVGNVVLGNYLKVIDLDKNGFICFDNNKINYISLVGDVLLSSDLYNDVEVHNNYLRFIMINDGNITSDKYYCFRNGEFQIPSVDGKVIELFYNPDNNINVIKISKEGNEYYRYFYINGDGFLFDNAEFDYATEFYKGIASVSKNGIYYAIDQTGDNIFNKTFTYLGSFEEGLAPFSVDGKNYGYIDSIGNQVIEAKYKQASNFKNGVARVLLSGFLKKKEVLIDTSDTIVKCIDSYNYKMIIEDGYYRIYDKYNARYIGIKYLVHSDYPDFTLCISDQGLILFNKKNGDYMVLVNGDVSKLDIKVRDRAIIVGDNISYYILEDNTIYNLSEYLDEDDIVSIGGYINNKNELLAFDVFKDNEELHQESVDQFNKRVESEELADSKISNSGFTGVPEVIHDMDVIDDDVYSKLLKLKEEITKEKEEVFEQIRVLNEKLSEIDNTKYHSIIIDSSMLFDEYEDHKEIKSEYINELVYLDLSNINFDEVKVSGLDLSNTNISLNPQTVYNKDMSNGCYDGVKFINNNFTGVNTDNSSFKDCDVPFTEFEIAEILD